MPVTPSLPETETIPDCSVHDRSGRIRTDPDELCMDVQGGVAITGPARVAVERIGPMQTSAKDLLITALTLLRQESGYPSLGELAQLSRGKFSKNTIDDHLSGRRIGIPNWRITSAYIQACQDFARSTGLNVERLGTMEEWRVRWQAAQAGDAAAASPIRDSGSMMTYSISDVDQELPLESPGSSITVFRPIGQFGTTAGTVIEDNLRVDVQSLKKSLPQNTGMLIVTNSPIIGTCFEVFDDLIAIGRDPGSNTVVLDDPTVSRRHAVIHRYGTAFTVRDVGSRNGTYLNQVKLTTESPLPSNEEIQIGVFRMWFIQGTREQG